MNLKIIEENSILIKNNDDTRRIFIEEENYSFKRINDNGIEINNLSVLSNKNHLQICKEINLIIFSKVKNSSIKCKLYFL